MLRNVIKLRRALVLVLVLSAPVAALAQQPQIIARPVRYVVRAWPDAVVTGAGAIAAWLPSALGDRLPTASCAPSCDPANLWGIDRGAVGSVQTGPDAASTAFMFATVGGSALLVMASHRGESDATRAILEDAAVMAETAAIDGAITQWLKVAVHRARPVCYTASGASCAAVEDSRSFPSGHASFAFAAAAAAASVLHRRGELHRYKIETVVLFAAAATTSVLRVAAHRHFPTDIMAGAALGTAIGWAIPQLHAVQ